MLPAIPNRNAVPRHSACVLYALCSILLVLCISASAAQSANLVTTPVNPANRVSLTGHHPAWASPQNDVGAVPADLPIERLTLILARPAQREQAYTQFLKDQQDRSSPNYHHWLTPVEIGTRFGVSSHDIHAVTAWLQSQGLHVDSISNSRERIIFSGPASGMANAFGAEMHYFTVSGEKRISITAEPQIPAALGQVVKSIRGLFTVKYYPQHEGETVPQPSHNVASGSGSSPQPMGSFSCGGNPCYFIFPADFAMIYNVNGVTGGINGAGQTIAIVGRSRVYAPDITNFASASGVTINLNPPNGVVPPGGIDPGAPAPPGNLSRDQGEATLDVTRAGSIAQGATILLVVSADSATVNGIAVDAQYVVDTIPLPAQIMNISFGGCENRPGGQGEVGFWDTLFKQAAGEGISVFVSSGDSGAAGCDTAFSAPPASQSLSPNAICSSSYATCVGGTEFADFANPSQYWSPTNGSGSESAISYIPEGAWNEPLNGQGKVEVAGTGGGVSQFIATPSWQVGLGVPSARTGRYTPDIAFSASCHDAYFICFAATGATCANNPFPFTGECGTSAAAPDMAGITALLNQKEGAPQGLLNPILYGLATNPANGVFNDVTVGTSGVSNCVVTTPSMCNNSTAGPNGLTGGLSGYLVDTGYDEATGLGSINVANLLTSWSTSGSFTYTTIGLSPSFVDFGATGGVVLSATVTAFSGGTPTGTVTFSSGGTALGAPVALSSGKASLNYNTSALAANVYSITATYSGDANFSVSASSSPLDVENFTVAANPATITIGAPGQSGTSVITITPQGGFNQTVTFSCPTSSLPAETTCTFNPTTVTPNGTTAASTTLTIQTTAATARLLHPIGRSGLYFAMLVPGLLGLVVLNGNRKRNRRGMRLLSLLIILGFSTLWMPACGGGSSGGGSTANAGTPTGTTNLTLGVTTTGSTQLGNPLSVTVTIN
jgi:subtilase family serine protease